MEVDSGYSVKVQRLEDLCIVPGCMNRSDRKYKGPQKSGWYCEQHGRTVSRHDYARSAQRIV